MRFREVMQLTSSHTADGGGRAARVNPGPKFMPSAAIPSQRHLSDKTPPGSQAQDVSTFPRGGAQRDLLQRTEASRLGFKSGLATASPSGPISQAPLLAWLGHFEN